MLALLRQLSLRHLTRSPLRAALVMLGIALGVAMFVATHAANQSIVAAFDEMIARVAGRADLVVLGRGTGSPGELTGEFAEIEGVAHAAASVEVPLREAKTGEPLLVLGVDFLGDTHFLPFDVASGEKRVVEDPLAFVNDPTAILIARSLAKRRNLSPGDPLTLVTADGDREFRVRGVLDDVGPAAAFGGQVAVMFMDAAQVAFARGTLVDRIDVAIEKGGDVEAVQRRISAAVGPRAKVERPERKVERVEKLMVPFRAGVMLSGVIALVVGLFLIYNAVGIAVAQRRREVGILRALGATRRSVVALFCLEATLMALPGVALGILLARFLAVRALEQTAPTVTRMYAPIRPPEPVLTVELVVAGVVAGIVTTLLAAYWPARRASSIDPVESLRPPGAGASVRYVPYRALLAYAAGAAAIAGALSFRPTRITAAIAMVLLVLAGALAVPAGVVAIRRLAVGATDRLLGVPGRLGIDNVARTLGRSALNVVALMVAVAMSVTLGCWLGSFQKNVEMTVGSLVAGDLMITAGSPVTDQYNVPFSPAALEKLRGLPGVEASLPTRLVTQDIGEEELLLSAVDSERYLAFLQRRGRMPDVADGATPVEPRALVDRPRIVINETAARRLGVRAGETLELAAPNGPARFEVRAVIVDYAQSPVGYLDRAHFIPAWGDESIDIIDLVLAPGADSALVARQVRERLGGGELLFVTELEAMTRELKGMVDEAFAYARSVELVTLLIALMGVVGTMTAAVLDRTRELGMLRAIGATRRQVAAAVVVESGFLGLSAAAIGIVAGTLQGALFLTLVERLGWASRLVFVFPGPNALRIAALVVVTAALAGLLPARRAARLDVKEALGYE
jgi:putative ABC transport system permease protein